MNKSLKDYWVKTRIAPRNVGRCISNGTFLRAYHLGGILSRNMYKRP
jgi:hypothetical protein